MKLKNISKIDKIHSNNNKLLLSNINTKIDLDILNNKIKKVINKTTTSTIFFIIYIISSSLKNTI